MSVFPQTAAASTQNDVPQARAGYDAGPPHSVKFNSRWDIPPCESPADRTSSM
jgi:hypothetical protein